MGVRDPCCEGVRGGLRARALGDLPEEGSSLQWVSENRDGFGKPEILVVEQVAPLLDPPRTRDGDKAPKLSMEGGSTIEGSSNR